MTDMLNKALEPIRRAELLARKVKLPSYMWDTTGGLEALARFMKEAQRAEVDAPIKAWADVEKAKADAYEDAARIIEKRAEDRRTEHGRDDPDTGGWDYPKHYRDMGNALDEEADDSAKAIRERKAKVCQVTQAASLPGPESRGKDG